MTTAIGIGIGLAYPRGAGGGEALALDFATGVLDPRITYTRGTNATETGPDGLIRWSPANLLSNSEEFEASAWGDISAGTTTRTPNFGVAPDGTWTADRIQGNNANTWLGQTAQTIEASRTLTFSLWVRANSGNPTGVSLRINVTSGTTAFENIAPTSTWQRFSITSTLLSSDTGQLRCAINHGNGNDLLIWGAQLERGSVATAYKPSTVKNLIGFSEHFDNAAWTKSNAFVQTNLVLHSQNFTASEWAKGNVTVTANFATAPDGTMTATNMVTAATTNVLGVYTAGHVPSVVNTQSIYVKRNVGIRYVQLLWTSGGTSPDYANFDLQEGIKTDGTHISAAITPVGDSWFRLVMTSSLSTTPGGIWLIAVSGPTVGRGATYVGNGTDSLLIWGAQLVQGSTPGEYTRTFATAAPVRYTDHTGKRFAQKLVENTANNSHSAWQSLSVLSGQVYTLSTNAKRDERGFLLLKLSDGTTNWGRSFNLASGSVGAVISGFTAPTSANIVSLGDGWYRCSITATFGASGSAGQEIYAAQSDGTRVYTGDGTSGILIYGAQLSNSASLDPYVYNPVAAPAAGAYYGPRFDYDPVTLQPRGLLIEEARTNLLLRSAELSSSPWGASGTGATVSAAASPILGQSAWTINSQASSSAAQWLQNVSLSASTQYTLSCIVRKGTADRIRLQQRQPGVDTWGFCVLLWTGNSLSVESKHVSATATLVELGTAIYRVSLTATCPATASHSMSLFPANEPADPNTTTDFTAVQLEVGAFATSYIPTSDATATRNADVAAMVGNNFAQWFNQDEGSTVIEGRLVGLQHSVALAVNNNGTYGVGNGMLLRVGTSTTTVSFGGDGSSVSINLGTSILGGARFAGAYNMGTTEQTVASLLGTASNNTFNYARQGNQVNFGRLNSSGSQHYNGTIRSIRYWRTRLPNATLQAITA